MDQIMERLRAALKECDRIQSSVSQTAPLISGVTERVERLLLQCAQSSEGSESEKQAGQLREKLASVRVDIRKCEKEIARMKSDAAESFRALLGEHKEAYEQLSETEQITVSPEAHESKQTFDRLSKLEELMNLISADVMNLSGELEQQQLKRRDTPDIGHVEDTTDVPVQPITLS